MAFSKKGKIKAALVTNSTAPYRDAVYDLIHKNGELDLKVLYCSKKEKNRNWKNKVQHNHVFLKSFSLFFGQEKTIHFSLNIFNELAKIKPDVVISCGFTPTMICSFLYSLIMGKKHIIFIDSTLLTESKLPKINFILRKLILKRSNAFISPGKETDKLYSSFGIENKYIFRSCLAVNNSSYENNIEIYRRPYDIGFCGQFIDRKCPSFFLKIIEELSKNRKVRARICGNGPLERELIDGLKNLNCEYKYDGYLDQKKIKGFYKSIKILAFPTHEDCWGLVINEAMASGTLVITSPESGAVNDLLINMHNGFCLEKKLSNWVCLINDILDSPGSYEKIISNALEDVSEYNHESASKGILEAIKFVKK